MLWHDPAIQRLRLRRRVSLAVMSVDDFTGRPITGADLIVTAAELSQKPVRKQDGYFLFLDCPLPALTVTAAAWAYHPQSVRVELGSLSPLRPVVKLRLTPNRNYRLPPQTTCLEGTARSHAKLQVFCENDPRPLRLLYDYTRAGDGRCIQLYDPACGDLDGRQFALLRRNETQPDFFTVQESLGQDGLFQMDAPLSKDCKKAGATIVPVSLAQADEAGSFFLPLHAESIPEYRCCIFWEDGGKSFQRRLTLETNRVTRLNLLENN